MPEQNQEISNREILAGLTSITNKAASGHLDNLECPSCHQPSVLVWFTNPAENTYRTWFLCTQCDFHSRAQNAGKPTSFTEDRRCADLEDRDRSILLNAVFKRPIR
jgi:hypothetical protein